MCFHPDAATQKNKNKKSTVPVITWTVCIFIPRPHQADTGAGTGDMGRVTGRGGGGDEGLGRKADPGAAWVWQSCWQHVSRQLISQHVMEELKIKVGLARNY